MECKHETLKPETKRQVVVKDTLLIKDCAICGSTITVGRDEHTEQEAAYMAALIASIMKGHD